MRGIYRWWVKLSRYIGLVLVTAGAVMHFLSDNPMVKTLGPWVAVAGIIVSMGVINSRK
jgi:hypothetical protein